MLDGKDDAEIQRVVAELSTRDAHHSHGSVIDHREAVRLGLNVTYLEPNDELWRWFWLLRRMYEADARSGSFSKVFEGRRISSSIQQV